MGGELDQSSTAIGSSNIGFQLLRKCGWKEGTGLGVAEQGRLEPLKTFVKKNKRGLGAEETKNKSSQHPGDAESGKKYDNEHVPSRKKTKTLSKRLRKMQEEEKRFQEKDFERAFFREFWPDNI